MTHKLIKTDNYLLVVDDSVHPYDSSKVGNPLAHLPLKGSPILEGVDLLPPYSRHQEDGIEELGNRMFRNKIDSLEEIHSDYILGVTEGYQVAREKYKYTEWDMSNAIKMAQQSFNIRHNNGIISREVYSESEIIEFLHQYPTEFECEVEVVGVTDDGVNAIEQPKTITTAQGIQWVGKYK